MRVTVWNEGRHEKLQESVRTLYPDGIHGAIAAGIVENSDEGVHVRTWWGHMAHPEVSDAVVERVHRHVLAGMGLVVLHSGHWSKIFTRLMGTSCTLRWRDDDDRELVWTVSPSHPITAGVPSPIVIDRQEMYGEFFDIPVPDELIFISSFSGGEVFRSGCTFRRGHGKIFYFSPGDQEYPVYHHPDVRRVIANGVRWAAPDRERLAPSLARYDKEWFTSGATGVAGAGERAEA
jgi:trehalose utilization protein